MKSNSLKVARHLLAGALNASLLAGCVVVLPRPQPAPSAYADVILTTEPGMRSIVFDARGAYLALSNSATAGTAVLRSGAVVNRSSVWSAVALTSCALGPARDGEPVRSPVLTRLDGKIYLFQSTFGSAKEHSLCQFERALEWFAPRDEGLRVCSGLVCEHLWMTDLQAYRKQLFSNLGAGLNVLASADQGRSWRALLGSVESYVWTDSAFRIVGARLLVGGECPLDIAYLRAYQLAPDGVTLASTDPLPVTLPALENRNVQFIREVGSRVFAGVEGGLLRSTDGGLSFQFVIRQPLEGPNYPYIGSLLALRNRPDVMLVGGFDKANGKPYLALSRDAGTRWTDISASLPGYDRSGLDATAQVTALVQDALGRILLTLNLRQDSQGRLVLLTLAGVD